MKTIAKPSILPFLTVVVYILFAGTHVQGRDVRYGIHFSNNVVSLPVTGYPRLFDTKLHPGLDFTAGIPLKGNRKHQLHAEFDAGIYYHRFFQTGLRLHGSLDYRFYFENSVSLDAGLILGYLHSFTWYDISKLNDEGQYEKIPGIKGRPQMLGGLKLGASVPLGASEEIDYKLHLQFRTYLQAPFAGAYIPIIPTNSLMIGVSRVFTCKKRES
jgi:hypothetical protein